MKLSICVPTYNRRPWLEKCLNAFLEQTPGLPVEIVVSDNASPDDTWDLLTDMAAQHDQLKIFRNEVNNVCGNFADVVHHACGEYVWLFGDDDEPMPGAVARVLELIQTEEDFYILHCIPSDRNGDAVGPPIAMVTGERYSWDLTYAHECEGYFQSLQTLAGIGGLITLMVAKRAAILYGFRLTASWGADSMFPHLAALIAASSVHGKLTVVPDVLVIYQTCNDVTENYDAWERIMIDLRAVIQIADNCLGPNLHDDWFGIVRRHHGAGAVLTLRHLRDDDKHSWEEARAALVRVGWHSDMIALADEIHAQMRIVKYIRDDE